MIPGRWAGPRWALAGREEEERWPRNGPVWFRNPFFCGTFSNFVFSKPFANLVAVLKLFEKSNLLKIFKCLWNL
jgi:hypothetical protein